MSDNSSGVDLDDADVFIIDCGAEFTRAGFGGEDEPSIEMRTVIARSDGPVRAGRIAVAADAVAGPEAAEIFIGDEALAKRGVFELVMPISRGVVTDWDALEAVWRRCYDTLGVPASSAPVVLTEPPLNPRAQREEIVRRTFELGVPAVFIGLQPVLAAFASERTTALVVDLGASVSHVVPIWEGFAIPHAIRRLGVAGAHVTEYFARLLTEKGHYFRSAEDMETVARIKEKTAYVALDPDLEWLRFGGQTFAETQRQYSQADTPRGTEPRLALLSLIDGIATAQGASPAMPHASTDHRAPTEEAFELPDGQEIRLTSERFRCMEALFNPELVGREEPGLAECVLAAIGASGVDVRRDLSAAVVLSGGTSLARGMAARLERELSAGLPPLVRVKVTDGPEAPLLPWRGAAVLASLPTFSEMWITRAEYDIRGKQCVHDHSLTSH